MTTRREYLTYYSLVVTGYLLTGFFLFYDLSHKHNTFFMRSGSLLVILSAVTEYQLVMSQIIKHQYKIGTPIKMSEIASSQNITQGEKTIKLFTHISLILGTLIWGYGDLLVNIIA